MSAPLRRIYINKYYSKMELFGYLEKTFRM
jgi:hypothetical protein